MDRGQPPTAGSSMLTTRCEIPRKRQKRPRAARACERCRLKKYKCDELYPCFHCKKSQLDCVYQGVYLEMNRSASYIRDLEKKVEDLTTRLHTIESGAGKRQISPRRDSSVGPVNTSNRSNITPAIRPISACVSDLERSSHGDPISLSANENDDPTDAIEEEINEVNQHTNRIEFHGNTSSAAFLGHLRKARDPRLIGVQLTRSTIDAASCSLISTLHNPDFSPLVSSEPDQHDVFERPNFYVEQAHVFMDGYFENLHFINPFIDKEDFVARARDLWFGRDPKPETSFIALYFSLLSIGALVREWDEVRLDGLTRFEWSRKLFGEAQGYLNRLRFSNDLETVHCLFLMAKICQNELNPNMTYMYLGLAIRTCLSAGFNRETRNPKTPRSTWISRTWWGLFSLEIEMSFSVGRPDTLGMDEYHNRSLPDRDDSEFAVIPWMVDFSRIIRRVSIEIYHSELTLQEKMQYALNIERQLDRWVADLPTKIRPHVSGERSSLGALRDPKWSRRQRLVLGIRYLNVKMLLFRPFLAYRYSTHHLRQTRIPLEELVIKCLDSARKTIEVIHEVYTVQTFFRCWWYNTTYIMFAASILLLAVSKIGITPETSPLLESVEMAVEVLEAMDESVVAKKSVEILKYYLAECRRDSNPDLEIAADPAAPSADQGIEGFGFSTSELSYGFGFPDYSFEGMATLFDDCCGFSIRNN